MASFIFFPFSDSLRSVINLMQLADTSKAQLADAYLRHIGIYAIVQALLNNMCNWAPTSVRKLREIRATPCIVVRRAYPCGIGERSSSCWCGYSRRFRKSAVNFGVVFTDV